MVGRIVAGCLGCLGLIVLAIIVLIALAAIGVARVGVNSLPQGIFSSKSLKTGHLGTTIHVPDNLDVTLTGFHTSKGTGSGKPTSGNTFLITTWRFHNFRKSSTSIAPIGFRAQSKGVTRPAEMISAQGYNLLPVSGVSLARGATTTGNILFEVAKGAHKVTITYQPAVIVGTKAKWVIHP